MAFWASNLGRGSQIDTILDKEDVTLAEILEQPEVIQECKGSQNKKLIEFLTRTDILNQLLDLILHEPDPSLDENTKYKLPNIASEIITCDVKQINEKLSSDRSMLDKLYNFLDTSGDTPLNPLTTSFFSKVFSVFITRRSEQDYFAYQYTCFQVVEYMKNKPNFLGLLLKHIHTSAILDLLLRFIKCVEGKDAKALVLDWLNEGNLISQCIQTFGPRNNQPQPLVSKEQTSETVVTDEVTPANEEDTAPKTEGGEGDGGSVAPEGEGEEKKEEDVEMTEGSGGEGEEGAKEETTPVAAEEANTDSENIADTEAVDDSQNVDETSSTEDYWSEENLKLRDQHDNVGQLLVEIIRGSRDFMLSASASERCHNTLLLTAESREVCESLIDVMLLNPPRESVIVNIVSVLLCLLEVRKPMNMDHGFSSHHDQITAQTAADIQHQEEIVVQTVEILVPRLPQIVQLLANPPAKAPVATTAGPVNPPFGASRLWTCKLLATLLATKNTAVNNSLATTPFLNTQLDLFFQYTLNNFLHSQTENIIRSILQWEPIIDLNKTAEASQTLPSDTLQTPKVEVENPLTEDNKDMPSPFELYDNPLLVQLFSEARLLDRLVEAWDGADNDPKQAYMGHITQISNRLVELQQEKEGDSPAIIQNRILCNQIFQKFSEELRSRWECIVSDKLSKINTKNEIKSYREKHSSDDDSDFRDIQFPQDTTLQQRFSNYQMQLMNDNMEDTFGFTSEDFNTVEEGYGKMTASDSCLVVTDETKKAIFEKICSSRGSCDSDEEEDIWADKTAQITFGELQSNKKTEMLEHSSEEEDNDEEKMEVDHDPWNLQGGSLSGGVAMDTAAPWVAGTGSADSGGGPPGPRAGWDTTPASAETEGAGWANFDNQATQLPLGDGQAAAAVGQEASGWASFEAPSAADTSGNSVVEGGNLSGGAGNWADFSALDAAGGEGFGSTSLTDENKEKSDDWRPAMSSSPEATMLDQFEARMEEADRPGGVFRPESPDLSNSNANHAPMPSELHATSLATVQQISNANTETVVKSAEPGSESADPGSETADDKAKEAENFETSPSDSEQQKISLEEKAGDSSEA